MTPYEIMEMALKKTGLPFEEEIYHGKEEKYVVYNQTDQIPYFFVDNAPVEERTYYQVHYFCPLQPKSSDDSRPITRKIRKILLKCGFCITNTTRTQDQKRHVIIECNIITESEERED